ncbi:galactoside alpha-(1,2)-fucosyltransferase 2-like [Palaemon carinicauda]|uniref:galactoside alpha-(1,2)-fucosyltransferase 2-like n=1 Tax=Palaemon carinicauda TaxID=392227 RepID=UPI0035B676C0
MSSLAVGDFTRHTKRYLCRRKVCSLLPRRWFSRGAFAGVTILIIWGAGQLLHAHDNSKGTREYEIVEPLTNSARTVSASTLDLPGEMPMKLKPEFLDYDAVFANASTTDFPIMVFSTVGRLGNCLCSYATALTFSGRFNATVAVTEAIFHQVSSLFSPRHLTLPVIANTLIADADDMGALVSVNPDYLNDDMVSHLLPTIQKAVRQYQLTHESLLYILEGYPNRLRMLANHHSKIRQNFQIHEHLRKKALVFLQKIRKSMGSDVTFIGFHIRRGDYPEFFKKFFHCKIPGPQFYTEALNYYRSIIANPVFVVCTDDRVHAEQHFNETKDVILSDLTQPEEDLALLAQCSHSIMTVGSFGFWGSYLAGGEVVYPLVSNCSKIPFMHPTTLGELGFRNWVALGV